MLAMTVPALAMRVLMFAISEPRQRCVYRSEMCPIVHWFPLRPTFPHLAFALSLAPPSWFLSALSSEVLRRTPR